MIEKRGKVGRIATSPQLTQFGELLRECDDVYWPLILEHCRHPAIDSAVSVENEILSRQSIGLRPEGIVEQN